MSADPAAESATSDEAAAPDASNHHYDLPPQIFELFLDTSLKYSVGLFESEDDSLEEAQIRKMEYIERVLQLTPGARVLDAGCGWGSLTLFLAARGYHVTGITPSPSQADFVEGRARASGIEDRVTILRGVFEDQDLPAGRFNGITFVGSIVHMPDKRAILARSNKLLAKRGRLYLSETCFSNAKRYQQFKDGAEFGFIRDEIFGWGDCVPVSSYVADLEATGFSLCGLRDLTPHYLCTIAEWRRRAARNREAIEALRPGYTDQLLRYFDICNTSWGFTTKQYAVVAVRDRGRHLPGKRPGTSQDN